MQLLCQCLLPETWLCRTQREILQNSKECSWGWGSAAGRDKLPTFTPSPFNLQWGPKDALHFLTTILITTAKRQCTATISLSWLSNHLHILTLISSLSVCKTAWFNRDSPRGTGDYERLSEIRDKNPAATCFNPTAIEVQTVDGVPASQTGQRFALWDSVRDMRDISFLIQWHSAQPLSKTLVSNVLWEERTHLCGGWVDRKPRRVRASSTLDSSQGATISHQNTNSQCTLLICGSHGQGAWHEEHVSHFLLKWNRSNAQFMHIQHIWIWGWGHKRARKTTWHMDLLLVRALAPLPVDPDGIFLPLSFKLVESGLSSVGNTHGTGAVQVPSCLEISSPPPAFWGGGQWGTCCAWFNQPVVTAYQSSLF